MSIQGHCIDRIGIRVPYNTVFPLESVKGDATATRRVAERVLIIMAKKKKNPAGHGAGAGTNVSKPKPAFASPFKDLKKMLAERVTKLPETPPKPPPACEPSAPPEQTLDEAAILREAYAGVRRLGANGRTRMVPLREVNRPVVSEEAEVLAALSDLVSGQGSFDLTETEEYVEGTRVGIDPRLTTRLRHGEFAVQAHIDLHGKTQPDARESLTAFILDSVRKGLRTVLVVHGRGLGSPGGRPVLKHAAAQWLSHGTIGAHVLAFTTAKPQDGGAGATYVLLRRDRRRAAFDVLQGAKRRD